MKTFTIPMTWTMFGKVEVEAESLEQAIKKAYRGPLPVQREYVDDSCVIDQIEAVELNHKT